MTVLNRREMLKLFALTPTLPHFVVERSRSARRFGKAAAASASTRGWSTTSA